MQKLYRFEGKGTSLCIFVPFYSMSNVHSNGRESVSRCRGLKMKACEWGALRTSLYSLENVIDMKALLRYK